MPTLSALSTGAGLAVLVVSAVGARLLLLLLLLPSLPALGSFNRVRVLPSLLGSVMPFAFCA